jgi:hypothetical protein
VVAPSEPVTPSEPAEAGPGPSQQPTAVVPEDGATESPSAAGPGPHTQLPQPHDDPRDDATADDDVDDAGSGSRPAPAPAPSAVTDGQVVTPTVPLAPIGPGAVVGQVFGHVVTLAAEQVGRYVRPEAAVLVATEFTFPLALAFAVLVFLVVQHQVDRRDPKLRIAPQNVVETLIQFQGEEQL